jgi:Protein of unknown function (DUF2281)
MTPQVLLQQFNQMPEGMQQELLRFIDYLIFKYNMNQQSTTKPAPVKEAEIEPGKFPKAGFLKGTFVMTDDFDAPLEDFKEYME